MSPNSNAPFGFEVEEEQAAIIYVQTANCNVLNSIINNNRKRKTSNSNSRRDSEREHHQRKESD